ncbi:MAG: HAMP domain-containing histidine kinase [Actinobacteria bacterium]|nr:HAMP domain-containing histidine kinase [Actinomycetota bacterium]
MVITVFLAVILVLSSAFSPGEQPLWDDIIRAGVFLVVGVVIAELSLRRKRLIGDLEQRVKERTAELQASNEELDLFASSVSHDLIGPLATLQGYASIAKEAVSSGESELEMESLDAIDRLSLRVIHTIEKLLEHARSRKRDGSRPGVDTGAAASEVVADLQGMMSDKEVEVVVEENLPCVQVEAVKLKQVLANLVGNAAKHAASGRPLLVEIGGTREGDVATLFVRDDGPGIEPDHQEMVFEEFTQLNEGGQTSGLGMGLHIVKRAVEGWGGRVWLESSPGEGTTFYFTAPL